MGLRFRKSMNFGPFRINLSKSGVGYSVGGKGFRWTKKATGGTRTTASIPGTGISYVSESGKKIAAPAEKKRHPILKALGIAALALILLGFLGAMLSGCGGGSSSPSPSPSPVVSVTPSQSESPKPSEAVKPSESVKPSETPKPSESVKPSETPKPSQSAIPSKAPKPSQSAATSAAPSPSASVAPSVAPSPTPTVTPSASPSVEPSPVETPAPSASVAPSVAPSETPSPSASVAPSVVPSPSATPKPSPSATPAPSASVVVPSQPEKDEVEYVLNTNTKKFHKPTCKSVKDIKPENLGSITGRDNAVAQGYSPCGRCKP